MVLMLPLLPLPVAAASAVMVVVVILMGAVVAEVAVDGFKKDGIDGGR